MKAGGWVRTFRTDHDNKHGRDTEVTYTCSPSAWEMFRLEFEYHRRPAAYRIAVEERLPQVVESKRPELVESLFVIGESNLVHSQPNCHIASRLPGNRHTPRSLFWGTSPEDFRTCEHCRNLRPDFSRMLPLATDFIEPLVLPSQATEGAWVNIQAFEPFPVETTSRALSEWIAPLSGQLGTYTRSILPFVLESLNLMLDIDIQGEEALEIVREHAPDRFACQRCGTEQSYFRLASYQRSPKTGEESRTVPARFHELIRLGPSLLCNRCRRASRGRGFVDIERSRTLNSALIDYLELYGELPEPDWNQRPLFFGLPAQMSEEARTNLTSRVLDIACRMPDFNHPQMVEHRRRGGPLWWSMLARAGLVDSIPHDSWRGNRSIAPDGHLCLSILEWRICSLLSSCGISHQKEPRYSQEHMFRADFAVGDLLVEVAGLDGDPAYDARLSRKLDLAQKLGVRVAVLRPRDVQVFWRRKEISIAGLEAHLSVKD